MPYGEWAAPTELGWTASASASLRRQCRRAVPGQTEATDARDADVVIAFHVPIVKEIFTLALSIAQVRQTRPENLLFRSLLVAYALINVTQLAGSAG